MEKVIVALFLITSILLFGGVLNVHEESEIAYIHQIETAQVGVVSGVVAIDNRSGEIDRQAVLSLFAELTKQYDLLISIRAGDYSQNQFDFYCVSDTPMDVRLGLVTDVSVVFDISETAFYTNQAENAVGEYFYTLNRNIDVNIYPMSYLKAVPSTAIFFTAGTEEALDESITAFLNRFGDYATRMGISAEPYVVRDKMNAFLPTAILTATGFAFLLLVMVVQTKSKKIAILKTMGTSLFVTASELFSHLFFWVIATVTAAQAFLFLVFVAAVNERTLPMIKDLSASAIGLIVGAALAVALSCCLLAVVPTYALLKNNRLNYFLMNVNYSLKIIVLLTVIPAVSGMVSGIEENLAVIRYATTSSAREYQFVRKYQPEYEWDGYDLSEYMREYSQTHDTGVVENHALLYEYQMAYQVLNNAGAILCKNYLSSGNEPGIMVNENYLNEYPIKDVDGNWVDVDAIDADVIYFVPESYHNDRVGEFYLADPYYNTSVERVVIADKQEIFIFNPSWGQTFLQPPQMIMLYKDTAFRLDASIFWDVYIEADINELLKETSFYNKIVVTSLEDSFAQMREVQRNLILDKIWVFPALAAVFLVIVQYAYLYRKVYAQRIFIRKILGHSPFFIFGRLLAESSLVVIIALAFSVMRRTEYRLFLLNLALEILSYLAVVLQSSSVRAKHADSGEG